MRRFLSKIQAEKFMFEPVFYKPGKSTRANEHSVEKMFNVLKDVKDKVSNGEAFSKLDLKKVCTKYGVGVFSKYIVKPIYTNGIVPTIENAEMLRMNLNGWINTNNYKENKVEKVEEKHDEVQGVIDFGEPIHVDEMIKDVCIKIRMLRHRGYIFECENGGLTIKKLFTTKIL